MKAIEANNDNIPIVGQYAFKWSVILPRFNTDLIKHIPCISQLKLRYPKDLTFKHFNLDFSSIVGNFTSIDSLESVYISEGLKPLPLFLFIDILNSEMLGKTNILPISNAEGINPNVFWVKDGKKKFFIVAVVNNFKWHFFIPHKKQTLPESWIVALQK